MAKLFSLWIAQIIFDKDVAQVRLFSFTYDTNVVFNDTVQPFCRICVSVLYSNLIWYLPHMATEFVSFKLGTIVTIHQLR